jgi:MHS family citrate/tricarballylate:H+ symporter-like MFS transporter
MTVPAETPTKVRRHVAAAVVGNALEFYDFITYSFFAIQIGHAFFPKGSDFTSLMLSLATFGAGFITRPIGGLVIGAFADRVGRRSAMLFSFTLMGLSIISLAIIPPYAVIGVAAPILAVLARMAQGFALGGEVGPNTAYLLEVAAPNRRGLYVSWQAASQTIASVTGSAVGLGLTWFLPHAALESYGWRIAFLIGAVTLPVGFILRRAMPETLHAPEDHPKAHNSTSFWAILRDNRRILSLGVVVLAGGTISTYVTNYMTTYAQNTLHMAAGVAFAATMVPNAIGMVSSLYGGWLSDRIGRRPVMLVSRGLALIVTLPVFYWIVATHSAWALLGGMGLLAFVGGAGQAVFYVALSETLPKPVRGRAFATLYATAIAVFGGTTQPMITWLIHVTGNPMAPGWYLLGATAASLMAIFLILESAPIKRPARVLPDSAASHAV